MTQDNLKEVLRLHSLWLANEPGGKRADLCSANLRGAILCSTNLCSANLRGAILCSADLSGAILRGADLRGANLSGADLRGADLSGADLSGADLSGADLSGTNLSDAILSDAILSDAILRSALGNGREVRSLQCGTYCIAYTAEALQIGCEHHPIDQWWEFSDDEIDEMDRGKALAWWRVWKPLLQQIITAAYTSGALACRRNIYAGANPFRDGTQSASDWNDGYTNEETGVHDGFDVDPIGCSDQGITFTKIEI